MACLGLRTSSVGAGKPLPFFSGNRKCLSYPWDTIGRHFLSCLEIRRGPRPMDLVIFGRLWGSGNDCIFIFLIIMVYKVVGCGSYGKVLKAAATTS